MQRPPRSRKEGVINAPMLYRAWIFLGLIEAALVLGGFFFVLWQAGWSSGADVSSGSSSPRSVRRGDDDDLRRHRRLPDRNGVRRAHRSRVAPQRSASSATGCCSGASRSSWSSSGCSSTCRLFQPDLPHRAARCHRARDPRDVPARSSGAPTSCGASCCRRQQRSSLGRRRLRLDAVRRNWFIAAIVIGVAAIVIAAVVDAADRGRRRRRRARVGRLGVHGASSTGATSITSLADVSGETLTPELAAREARRCRERDLDSRHRAPRPRASRSRVGRRARAAARRVRRRRSSRASTISRRAAEKAADAPAGEFLQAARRPRAAVRGLARRRSRTTVSDARRTRTSRRSRRPSCSRRSPTRPRASRYKPDS